MQRCCGGRRQASRLFAAAAAQVLEDGFDGYLGAIEPMFVSFNALLQNLQRPLLPLGGLKQTLGSVCKAPGFFI